MPNISLSGKAIEGDDDHYWLNLYASGSEWNAGETDGTSKISDTKMGRWVYKVVPDKGTYAMDSATAVVFFFRNLDPASAKVGDNGHGHAYEKARIIDWRVDSL